MEVFLAFSFRPEDKPLVTFVDQLFASHHIYVVTWRGRVVGIAD